MEIKSQRSSVRHYNDRLNLLKRVKFQTVKGDDIEENSEGLSYYISSFY